MNAKRGTGRLVAGLIVIAVGALFLLGTLDVLNVDIGEIFGWIASILLIAFGLGILVAQRFRRVLFPLILVGIGLFILLGNLEIDAYQYWPVILIIVGVAIIFRGRHGRSHDAGQRDGGQSSVTSTDGEVNINCTLGEANERVETDDFRGGRASVTMGNASLDLRDSEVAHRPATLDVSLTMAGLNLRVPPHWAVSMETDVTMGEAEDKRWRIDMATGTPHLVINGKVTMGNLEIND